MFHDQFNVRSGKVNRLTMKTDPESSKTDPVHTSQPKQKEGDEEVILFTSWWAARSYYMQCHDHVGGNGRHLMNGYLANFNEMDESLLGSKPSETLMNALERDVAKSRIEALSLPDMRPATINSLSLGVSGFAPCVPNFIQGLPNDMWCHEPQETGRSVCMFFDNVTSSGVSSADIRKRTNVAMGIINYLNLMGVGVDLWISGAYTYYEKGHYKCRHIIHVSEPGVSWNEQAVRESMSGAACSRGLIMYHAMGSIDRTIGWNLGEQHYELMEVEPEKVISINSMPTHSTKAAVEFLHDEMRRLGIVFDNMMDTTNL